MTELLTPAERKTLTAIVAKIEAATSLSDIDHVALAAEIAKVWHRERDDDEITARLSNAEYAVSNMDDEENEEFEDAATWAVQSLNRVLDYRRPRKPA